MSLWTLAFQTANFLVLAAVLKRVLFRPIAAMVAHRQEQIEAASKEVQSARRSAEESRVHYEQERDKLRATFDAMGTELRAQVAQERAKLAQQSRAEASALLESARVEIERERREAAAHTAADAVTMGVELATRMLELSAGPRIAETLLGQVCDHLESLPVDRRRMLSEEVARGAGTLEVATAPALAPDAQQRWGQRISQDFEGSPAVRFVTDPQLIAGAELRLLHTKISICWRDGLDAAREELARHADGR
ncbi:MAG TPA: hypothetical protein VEK07_22300 [Polyangiaceae bacterium]|nr:hypothetical protein [Polyangiaceae bacterium]